MKTTKSYLGYLFLALILAFSLGLTSCSDEDKDVGSTDDLIGTWRFIDFEWTISAKGEKESGVDDYSNKKTTIKFKENGTAIMTDQYNNNTYSDWSYKGNKLSLLYEDEEDETFTVTTLTSTELIFETNQKGKEDGITFTLHGIWRLKKTSN